MQILVCGEFCYFEVTGPLVGYIKGALDCKYSMSQVFLVQIEDIPGVNIVLFFPSTFAERGIATFESLLPMQTPKAKDGRVERHLGRTLWRCHLLQVSALYLS